MICPYCSSNNIVKGGHLKSGSQRYSCKACGKSFSSMTNILPKLEKKCPVCSSSHIVRCGKSKGNQRYLCRTCGKRFEEEKIIVPKTRGKVYEGVACPTCGYNHLYKSGYARNGARCYRCTKCNRTFLIDGKYYHLTEKEKKFIITYALNLSVPRKDIANYLKISDKTVYRVISKFREGLKK